LEDIENGTEKITNLWVKQLLWFHLVLMIFYHGEKITYTQLK
jgi:hypothetical protein